MGKTLIVMLVFISVWLRGTALGDENQPKEKFIPEVTVDLNYSSIYIWRGIMLDGDPCLQPGLYIKTPKSKLGRIKLGVWMSEDMADRDALKSKEIDYIFDYTYNYKDIDFSIGHTYYDFPDAVASDGAIKGFSREAYLAAALTKVFLTPTLYYYYDYGNKEDGGGEGSYIVGSLSHSMPLTFKGYDMSFDITGHIGHNNKLYYRGKGGDFGCTAFLAMPVVDGFMLKPNVSLSVPWGNISDKENGKQKNRVYAGVYASYNF